MTDIIKLDPLTNKKTSGQKISKVFNGQELHITEVDAKGIQNVFDDLQKNIPTVSAKSPTWYIRIFEKASRIWLNPHSDYRKEAVRVLSFVSGKSKKLIEEELDVTAEFLTSENIERVLKYEIGNRNDKGLEYLEGWVDEGLFWTHIAPRPGIAFHNLAGNTIIVPVLSSVYGLLAQKASLLKLSSADPYFGHIFVRSLWSIEPSLRKVLNAVYWSGKNHQVYEALFPNLADHYVVQWGAGKSTATIQGYCEKYKVKKLVNHGPRFSFEVIENGNPTMAYDIAKYDVILWEQQSCSSPRFIFVLADEKGCQDFAGQLAASFTGMAEIMPKTLGKGHINFIAVQENYKKKLELSGKGRVYFSKESGWGVIYSKDKPTFDDVNACNGRVLFVSPIKNLEEVIQYIDNMKLSPYLQIMGYDGDDQEFCKKIGAKGAALITYPGEMNYRMGGVNHDGMYNLRELMDPIIVSRQKKIKLMTDALKAVKRSSP
ncbi:MAG: hypothetical protein JSV88_17785 [Candidatus Aminicenantes bacterium]|nr:MAG: hypothetical protein JSV88_17785 [Candidatus Aminicenantes bacterium]